jgi:RNA polymerase sigma-70 factor (ECF subfamily)
VNADEAVSGAELGAPDETALVKRARGGDQAAWSDLYTRYYDPVFRYLRARLREPALAEDLAADVFVAAVQGIRQYRAQRPFLAWLFGIARNMAHNHARRAGRHTRIFGVLWRPQTTDADPLADIPMDARPEAEQVADHLDLMGAMDELTDAQREVVTLRYFVGLSTAEIGIVMGKDASAVYSLHARALIALRQAIEPQSPRDEFRPSRTITGERETP